MMPVVLDTSAILAVIFSERASERVVAVANGAMLSVVNLTEILTRCIDRDFPGKAASEFITYFNINLIAFDSSLAKRAAELRRTTRQRGLSLGDRVVEEVDTAPSRKWAPVNRPLRAPSGVSTGGGATTWSTQVTQSR